tara:strand:+ start:1579 stop:1725 length:147 start_codon:yes stop_codon:yes gene_type:complete
MRLALLVQLRLLQAVQVALLLAVPLASQVAFQRLAQPVELQEQEQDAP